ncbi:class I SAM-dependent methyltransferase [Streptomyces sp. ISL-98]|uniref:class I SAM-dependent methyltransferase n=1 Tax=Streptomyces sp. ISL-98 TaxID=2819192 RepID=UPI001BEC5CB6|nr:class I SAM-dependent methyltransferase [Streptomyces sp. ISL-98]MBT2508910.1 class I SAM-dependent methyltransferase [Streptomyces sp. ISL-98]
MALAALDQVKLLLVCPQCRSALVAGDSAFHCVSAACPYHPADAFPVVGRLPVLVDFERSILRRQDLVGPPRAAGGRLPQLVRGVWKPLNRVAVRNTERLLRLLPGPAPTLLVVGGGTVGNGVAAVYADPRVQVIGFDIAPSAMTQFVADAHQIPLADRSVDAVLVQAVLEHVLDPAQVVSEIHRVLVDGGLVYAETPFLQQVHAGAYDFLRFTASGHRYLFRRFSEIDAGTVAGPGTQLLWSADHLVRGLTQSTTAGRLTRGALFWLRYLDALVPAGYASDNASALYFLGRKRDREMSPKEIVRYYRGAQRPR